MNEAFMYEVWEDGRHIDDWSADTDETGEVVSNGCIENIIEYNGKKYSILSSWDDEPFKISELSEEDE